MLTELRTKSQITIPKDIVMKMGLREGDKLEIVEKDGVIELMPVAVYPKKYLDELRSERGTADSRMEALKAELAAVGYNRYRRSFTPREVSLLVKYLGEP